MHRETSVFICGVYLMVYGITYIQDFIRQVYPSAFVPGKRRLHLGWPAFLVALMPNAMIKKINAMYAKKQVPPLHAEKSSAPPDIEVFVHASEEGFSKFGHVDLYFEGRVYTYGCYEMCIRDRPMAFGCFATHSRCFAAIGTLCTLPH